MRAKVCPATNKKSASVLIHFAPSRHYLPDGPLKETRMKRRIVLSIALALSIISVLLMSLNSSVEAESPLRYSASTGVVTLAPGENLSLTITGGAPEDAFAVRFRRTRYVKTDCAGGVCRYVVESQTTTPTMISAPNQSSKLDLMGETDTAGSIEVLSSSPNARVTVQISDAVTGQTKSVLIALLLP